MESGLPQLEPLELARHPENPHTDRDPELVRVGVGLQMTYIGSPMIFSGEELGFEGTDGEDSRWPMPWLRRTEWDHRTLDMFTDLIAIRQAHSALCGAAPQTLYGSADLAVGTLDDLKHFVRAAHDQGMYLILDWDSCLRVQLELLDQCNVIFRRVTATPTSGSPIVVVAFARSAP